MILQNEIADAIEKTFYEGGPAIYDQAAAAVIALLRERADDTTWYCSRFGSAAYDSDICGQYHHKGCGYRHLLALGGEE
jgi:hypothetical protein